MKETKCLYIICGGNEYCPLSLPRSFPTKAFKYLNRRANEFLGGKSSWKFHFWEVWVVFILFKSVQYMVGSAVIVVNYLRERFLQGFKIAYMEMIQPIVFEHIVGG